MSTEEKAAHVTLHIGAGDDSDADELDRLTRQLRDEIEELGVESVEFIKAGPAPQGSKLADPVTLGALAIAVLPVFAPKLIEFLQAWTTRGSGQTVKIKTGTMELEFTPDKPLAIDEIKSLVDKLSAQTGKKK